VLKDKVLIVGHNGEEGGGKLLNFCSSADIVRTITLLGI
jgi:hypothetical protein